MKRVVKDIIDQGTNFEQRFIPDFAELKDVVEALKKIGCRIVLTQGVYDLIHEGHVKYMELARSHGDVLVVGVDSDALTRKRKGDNRPIVPQAERVRMLASLRCVSIITLRELEHGMDDLIEIVRPDVLITSQTTADFPEEKKVRLQEFCGRIEVLPAQAETSSSERIRRLAIDGTTTLVEGIMRLIKEHTSGNGK
jgi:rfaE bifunctional protein nucleotidyltransferase chain/domain